MLCSFSLLVHKRRISATNPIVNAKANVEKQSEGGNK